MINPKELRIGNLLFSPNPNAILKVISIKVNGFEVEVINRDQFPLPSGWRAQYIPITDDWLKKLGIIRMTDKIYIHPSTSNLMLYNKSALGGLILVGGRSEKEVFLSTTKDLHYVHDIQNAFALAGVQLELNK
jgi:hypothetical protein